MNLTFREKTEILTVLRDGGMIEEIQHGAVQKCHLFDRNDKPVLNVKFKTPTFRHLKKESLVRLYADLDPLAGQTQRNLWLISGKGRQWLRGAQA